MNKRIIFIIALLCTIAQGAWAQEITEVGNATELTNAIANGAYITLTDDITLSKPLNIPNNTSVLINLNSHYLKRNLNSATSNGCVIIVNQTGNLILFSGEISGGWNSTSDGVNTAGGIVNKGTLEIHNALISNCKGNDGGGIMNVSGATLNITGCTISNCLSNAGGGAIVNKGTATINNCTISGNTATTRGGAIWSNSSLTVSGGTMNNNTAQAGGEGGDGGAIHIESGTPTLTGVTLTGNESNDPAGALYIKSGTTTLTDVTITNNTAKDAGGIYVNSGATLNINGTSILSGNTSSEHGGGGIVNYGTVALSGSVSIIGNTCHTYGSGIWNNGTLTMQDNIQVKDNTKDDIFLKIGKVINVSGPLTCGANSLGIRMEFPNVFTNGYGSSGTETDPFYASGTGNLIDFYNGEAKMVYAYYESAWDSENHLTTLTLKTIPVDKTVKNICTSEFTTSGGYLNGTYWFVADGTGVINNSSLTCGSGDIHLILCDGADFTTDGLYVNEGSTLHIYSQSYGDFMGKLTSINSTTSKPGIGGEHPESMGTLIIYGGRITASGGKNAAGIGGGEDKANGPITIYAGDITATGGLYGAGIGGGEGGSGEHINIYGGNITATGGLYGAGIGGGQYYHGGGNCDDVTIWNGTIVAVGGIHSAGIGSGDNFNASIEHMRVNITIHGGTIFANGGQSQVGGGANVDDVLYGGAAIGGGRRGRITSITINGGHIYAKAKNDGAGIGSGGGADQGGTITINGGVIEAEGGLGNHNLSRGGAGIGAGHRDRIEGVSEESHVGGAGGPVVITGGSIIATAGNTAFGSDSERAAAIGHGGCGLSDGTLELPPDYSVMAGSNMMAAQLQLAADRVNGCRQLLAKIEPCEHLNASGDDNGASLSITCPNCYISNVPYTFHSDGDWNVNTNWLCNIIPNGSDKDVIIKATATIPHDCTAHVGHIDMQDGGSITIADGGQLLHSNAVPGTIQKNIVGYGDTDNEGGWYLLGTPIPIDSALAVNSGMLDLTNGDIDFTTHGIDLYDFDQNEDNEWVNMRTGDRIHFMGLTADQAYLYARANNATLNFSTYENRLFVPTSEEQLITVTRNTNEAEFAGWNLIPNPFTCNAYLASGRDFWRMNATGDAIVLATDENGGNVIKPCEGIFVVVAAENDPDPFILWGETVPDCAQIRFTTTESASSGSKGLLDITVKHNGRVADVARVRFGEGDRTNKLVLDETATRISIMQDGKDYSVVHNEAQGEMPVSFKAKANGTYTISVNPEDVEVNYLHLIDNLTGNEVDMLATPNYTFEAKTTDYASRFKLVFATENNETDDNFAYISNGNIIVNGEGTLQVMDMTGRIVRDGACTVSTSGMAPAVYVLRLINGNDVKTQKIIIR